MAVAHHHRRCPSKKSCSNAFVSSRQKIKNLRLASSSRHISLCVQLTNTNTNITCAERRNLCLPIVKKMSLFSSYLDFFQQDYTITQCVSTVYSCRDSVDDKNEDEEESRVTTAAGVQQELVVAASEPLHLPEWIHVRDQINEDDINSHGGGLTIVSSVPSSRVGSVGTYDQEPSQVLTSSMSRMELFANEFTTSSYYRINLSYQHIGVFSSVGTRSLLSMSTYPSLDDLSLPSMNLAATS
jgi:hypothetical protein